MRLMFRLFVSLCLAFSIGLGTAWYMVTSGSNLTVKKFGPWEIWVRAANPAADPYTRAHFARSGSLPITATSAYYFKAKTDSNNSPLLAYCEYSISGPSIDIPWWSLTVYDSSGQILSNKARRYSFHKDNIFLKGDSSYEIRLSPRARSGNWLPTTGSGEIKLLLRMYHGKSSPELSPEDPLPNQLPQIKRVDC